MRLSEAQIARQCCDLLRLDGWRILNCEPVSRKEWGKGFGEKGMPDTVAVRYLESRGSAEVLWCEWKAGNAKPSPIQRAWHEAERCRGALVVVANEDFPASLDGFMSWYRKSGLCRRVGL